MLKISALALMVLLAGCQAESSNALDPDRILHMAGEEAGQITVPKERLTRQLNIANRETETGRPANARATLALARQTLERADKKAFTDQERLAGWISICELARNAGDKAFAGSALDQAMAALTQLMPDPARCEYVPGIEHEVRTLRGDSAAAALLRTAADWAMDLRQGVRRRAYFAFAEELFRCNDYEGGRAVLRHEADAAWRSDALTAMADMARGEIGKSETGQFGASRGFLSPAQVPMATVAITPTTGPTASSFVDDDAGVRGLQGRAFGKSLDFKSNYYRP